MPRTFSPSLAMCRRPTIGASCCANASEALLALRSLCAGGKIFQELCRDVDGDESAEELRVKTQLALSANRLGRRNEASKD